MHHQIAFPFNMSKDDYRIIAWAENLSDHHEDGDGHEMEVPVEPEIVYFPKTQMLGSQFHNECLPDNHPTVKYCQDLLDKFMDDKL